MAIYWRGEKIEKLCIGDFQLRHRFSDDLSDDLLQQALQMVNAQFSGVYRLWAFLPPDERRAKRELCINYLLGWQLANSYPDYAVGPSGGVAGVGAVPLKGKKIGPIALTYRDTVRQGSGSILDMLTTNEFGIQALTMIQTAPENFMLAR